MNAPLTVECHIEFRRLAKGRKQVQEAAVIPRPLVPRATRVTLDGLGHSFRASVARQAHRQLRRIGPPGPYDAGADQPIMNLLHLAPDVQEAILFLPRKQHGRDPILLRDLQPIAAVLNWREQRKLWSRLTGQ